MPCPHSAPGADAEEGRQLQVVAAGHAEAQPGPSQPGPQQGFTQIPTPLPRSLHACMAPPRVGEALLDYLCCPVVSDQIDAGGPRDDEAVPLLQDGELG